MVKYFTTIQNFALQHGGCGCDDTALAFIKRLRNGEERVSKKYPLRKVITLDNLKSEMSERWDVGDEFEFILETWVTWTGENKGKVGGEDSVTYQRDKTNTPKEIELAKIKKLLGA